MREVKRASGQRNAAFPKKAALALVITVSLVLLTTGCSLGWVYYYRDRFNDKYSNERYDELESRPIDHAKIAELNLGASGDAQQFRLASNTLLA